MRQMEVDEVIESAIIVYHRSPPLVSGWVEGLRSSRVGISCGISTCANS